MIGIYENIQFPALQHDTRHEKNCRATLVEPLVAEAPTDNEVIRSPPFEFIACDGFNRNILAIFAQRLEKVKLAGSAALGCVGHPGFTVSAALALDVWGRRWAFL
jgi:hypothetical protein